MPLGFMDATAVWRNEAPGSGIGSSFGSMPYSSAVPGGKLDELRFSPQNSRLGFRIDGDWKGLKFIGYNEFDFLGTSRSNNAIGVTNGAFVPRLRLFWVNVRKGPLEFLGGQSWSLVDSEPQRHLGRCRATSSSAQVVDVNYVLGLPWTRQPGFRFVVHAPQDKSPRSDVSLEQPQPVHGRLGRRTADYAADGSCRPVGNPVGQHFDQLSEHSEPDARYHCQAGIRLSPRAHVEVAGLVRDFKVYNLTTGQPTSGQTFSKMGDGGSVNANFEVFKNFRLITNNFLERRRRPLHLWPGPRPDHSRRWQHQPDPHSEHGGWF